MRVAAVSWAIREVRSFAEYLAHLDHLIALACREQAQLVVLPESIDLERCSLRPDLAKHEIPQYLAEGVHKVFHQIESLAYEHKITLVGGTHLRHDGEKYVNSAIIATPDGVTFQDKNVLTQWELNEWEIDHGAGLSLTPGSSLGVTVCYDVEFPGSVRALAEAGCKVIAVPAFNEVQRGFHRVRWTCHARTVECQVYVIHAALVGSLGREPVPTSYGSSAVLCPSVLPMPESGILAETPLNAEGVAIADIDLSLIEVARNSDDVRNWHDRDRGLWQVAYAEPQHI